MKVKIEIDADAQEMREFFGLPDLRPLQQQLLQQAQDGFRQFSGFDAMNALKPLFPAQLASLDGLQRAFWESLQQAGDGNAGGGDGDAVAADGGTTRRRAGRKKTR